MNSRNAVLSIHHVTEITEKFQYFFACVEVKKVQQQCSGCHWQDFIHSRRLQQIISDYFTSISVFLQFVLVIFSAVLSSIYRMFSPRKSTNNYLCIHILYLSNSINCIVNLSTSVVLSAQRPVRMFRRTTSLRTFRLDLHWSGCPDKVVLSLRPLCGEGSPVG